MAKMKIYDIARSLQEKFPDLKSKDLVELLQENGFEVKSAQSSIEDEAIGFLLNYYKKKTPKPAARPEKTAKKEQPAVKKEAAPKKEQPKKKEAAESKKADAVKKEVPEQKEATEKTENVPADVAAASAPSVEKEAGKPSKAETVKEETKISSGGAVKEPPKKKEDAREEKAEKPDKAERPAKDENKTSGKAEKPAKTEGNKAEKMSQQPASKEEKKTRTENAPQRERNAANSRTQNQHGGQENRQNGHNRGGNGNNKNTGRDGGNNRGNRNDRRDGNKDNRQGRGYNNRDNRDNNSRDNSGSRQGGYANRNGKSGSFDSRRNAQAPMEAMKPEVKQSRQQRANKDSRSAKQRHGKDRGREEFEEDVFNQSSSKARKKKDPNRKGAFIRPEPVAKPKEPEDGIRNIILPEKMTIKELADIMKVPAATVIKKLFLQGNVVSLNHEITYEEAEEIALEYNCIAEMEEKVDKIAELLKEDEEDEKLMKKRPPVVCVMGHVDHGKTSLLDAIREAHVTDKEAGGITQHIGAYVTEINGEKITFLDTPGHEAFTSMRMRGAQSTDIAILVVAADDGVMPQTVEAINHAKAANVEIIVAVNKIDKPSANIERVKQELVEHGLVAEDWGGDTVFVPVSAHTKEGIDQLLEMIILTAEVAELKANPNRKARGVVIEAQLDKGRGPVATVLVQKGTLRVGDNIAAGAAYGKIRAMMNAKGHRVKEALPSTPVEILGLHDVPDAGEIFMATENDKEARNIAETYISQGREKLLDETKSKLTLDGLFSQIQAGNIKDLNLIVKADVQGSVEAVKQSLLKLSNDEVAVRIIHGGVGAITESDVSLASASNAIIIGFNVRPDNMAKEVADREKVDVRLYRIIYNAIEDIEAAMKGMLDPEYEEKVIGHAEIRQTFKASGVGTIAGSYVLDGKIIRGCKVRITREGEQIFEGELASLKRFKDDVKEVAAGYECGLVMEGFNEVEVEDLIEAYIMVEVPR
ncbi:translation initiation factor IF-2 [bacterium D16-51]|nr:translation initiation factor IF-2 [bacterium D16-59]RKI56920.1 translation initiation factor IF-2 [bacterium D16-51]